MKLNDLYASYKAGEREKHDYITAMHAKHQCLFDYHDYIQDTEIESIHIENAQIYVIMKNTGIKLFLDRYDSRFIPIEILNFKQFDPVERTLVFQMARQSKTVLDIGANIGWYSLNFSYLDNVNTIHSFEPIPWTFDYLTRHIDLNQVTKVTANNFALSNQNGQAEFYWNVKETGSSSMKNVQDREDSKRTTCKLAKLDDYVFQNNLSVDMIKCDVEGSELFVFQGATKTLARDKPFIFTEMLRKWAAKFDYHPNDIIRLLTDLGYQCYAYENATLRHFKEVTDDTQATNFFFIHPDNQQQLTTQLP